MVGDVPDLWFTPEADAARDRAFVARETEGDDGGLLPGPEAQPR